jgi:hypothetical protein
LEQLPIKSAKIPGRASMFLFDAMNNWTFVQQESDLKPIFKSPSLGFNIMSFCIAKNGLSPKAGNNGNWFDIFFN